jgi:hypothetical protein
MTYYVAGSIPEERYRRAQSQLDHRERQLTEELTGNGHLRILSDLPRDSNDLLFAWYLNGVDWQRSLVSAVLKEVRLHPKRNVRSKKEESRAELIWVA